MHVEAVGVAVGIAIDDVAADQLKDVRWAVVDHTPDAHALIRVQDIRGALLYGQPDPLRELRPPSDAIGCTDGTSFHPRDVEPMLPSTPESSSAEAAAHSRARVGHA